MCAAQVEHPVSEGITGVNIVGCQLCIAMGIPLARIHDIRKFYGVDPTAKTPIAFGIAKPNPPLGHVVACRITAENPRNSFKPTSGQVDQINMRVFPNVWGYFSIPPGGSVHEFADSQFGHIFAFGENRQQAIERLVVTLRELTIAGEIWTTHDFIVRLLESEDFQTEAFDTFWLDKIIAASALETMNKYDVSTEKIIACTATLMSHVKRLDMLAQFTSTLDRGQLPGAQHLVSEFPLELTYKGEKFSLVTSHMGDNKYCLVMSDSSVDASIVDLSDGTCLVHLDGHSHKMRIREDPMSFRVSMDGEWYIFEKENDPSLLRSAAPGKLIQYLVEDGAHLNKGEPYAEIESMKMVMTLNSTENGSIHLTKTQGATFGAGEVLGEFDLDDPSLCQRAVPSTLTFPPTGPPKAEHIKQHRVLDVLINDTKNLTRGLAPPSSKLDAKVAETMPALEKLLQDHQIPFMRFRDIMTSQCSALPADLKEQLTQCVDRTSQSQSDMYIAMLSSRKPEGHGRPRSDSLSGFTELPVKQMRAIIQNYSGTEEYAAFLPPLNELMANYENGNEGYTCKLMQNILSEFIDTQLVLQDGGDTLEDKMATLRNKYDSDAAAIQANMLSNKNIEVCTKALLELLDMIRKLNLTHSCVANLQDLCVKFTKPCFVTLVRTAQQLLYAHSIPSYDDRKHAMQASIRLCIDKVSVGPTSVMSQLLDPKLPIDEVLVPFFRHPEVEIRTMALKLFVLREYYTAKDMSEISFRSNEGFLFASWVFHSAPPKPGRRMTKANKNLSAGNLAAIAASGDGGRQGVLTVLPSVSTLSNDIPFVLKHISEYGMTQTAGMVINFVVLSMEHLGLPMSDKDFVDSVKNILNAHSELVDKFHKSLTITAITLSVEGAAPGYFSFRSENLKFEEVVRLRNVNPPRAALFELDRLSNFDIRVPEGVLPNMQVGPTSSLVYYGAEIGNDAVTSDTRLFVRAMCTFESANTEESVPAHVVTTDTLKAMLEDVLGTLEGVVLSATVPATQCNHLFLTTTSVISLAPEAAAALCEEVFMSCTDRLLASKVMQVEWVVQLEDVKLRCFAQLDGRLNSSSYVEDDSGHLSLVCDQDDDVITRTTSTTTPRKFVGQLAQAPHQVLDETVRRRCRARAMQTTFVFDYIHLFNTSAALEWDSVDSSLWPTERPTTFVEVQDMVVDQSDPDAEVVGLAQANYNIKDLKCGMIAWLITMKTIEYPDGRPIVVIANDITFMSGSFGVEEDYVYAAASRYARKHGLPRVYIAANAGARIGLAEEVKRSMRVAWNSPDDPAKGFKYLYLTEADYNELNADTKSVVASRVTDAASGEVRYQIDDVIGQKNGLGVENLQGSGLIAGETSRSYNECFSITYTTARTVGIGAYVLRLGQRAIQHNECSIILTGSRALNKLLGSEVYTSNQQLGGTRVMHNNGVSHLCAVNDADGINKIVTGKWILFIKVLPYLSHQLQLKRLSVTWNTCLRGHHMTLGAWLPEGLVQMAVGSRVSLTMEAGNPQPPGQIIKYCNVQCYVSVHASNSRKPPHPLIRNMYTLIYCAQHLHDIYFVYTCFTESRPGRYYILKNMF